MATSLRSGLELTLKPSEQREREVGLQVSLVKLVEDDAPDALQLRVGE